MTCIWYTKGLSVTGDAIAALRAAPATAGWTTMASHTRQDAPVARQADRFVVEPANLDAESYAAWVLETASGAGVTLVVAQRRAAALWPLRADFAARGIALSLAAAPAVLDLLDDKGAFQDDIATPAAAATGVLGHAVWRFSGLDTFDAVWAQARAATDATLCIKPARGIFGAGFRRVDEDGDELARIVSTDPGSGFHIALDAYRDALGRAQKPVPQILMPFLPGVERSVDFVARDGTVLAAVARAKTGPAQRIEAAGPSIDMARVLAARYRLNGICNLQTREDREGVPRVLEINPRMSGGLPLACLSGVDLPVIAALSALDVPFEAGTVRDGALVQFVQQATIVG